MSEQSQLKNTIVRAEENPNSNCENPLCKNLHCFTQPDIKNRSLLNIHTYSIKKKSTLLDVNRLKEKVKNGAHFLCHEELETVYQTSIDDGLTSNRAAELLDVKGPNILVDYQQVTYCDLLCKNIFGWFSVFLYCGACLSFVLHFAHQFLFQEMESTPDKENLYLGIVIMATTLCTGVFGFYQEAKNMKIMRGFQDMIPLNATVIRDSEIQIISCTDLVVGDIVQMFAGEMVPADVRIIKATNFKIDMSSITGESEAVPRGPDNTDLNYLETQNLAFFTCNIIEGTATGLVIATGEDTEIGRIAGLVTGIKKEETPIGKEITHFIKVICILAFVFGSLFFLLVFLVYGNLMTAFSYMLGIVIANVPEGLIVTLTACLTATALKLRAKNCLAKSLQAVECLGSTSCICTDKTGTLTINKMTVSHLFFNHTIINHNDYSLRINDGYYNLCFAASLCLRAEFKRSTLDLPLDERRLIGDASEQAVLKYMEVNFAASSQRENNPKVCEIPFNSTNKYQLSIHKLKDKNEFLLVMKGAPEIIIEFCTVISIDQQEILIDDEEKATLINSALQLGHGGERVLGYCTLKLDSEKYSENFQFNAENPNFPISGLTFVGLISLIDPPRTSVPPAIAKCRTAGIRVIMVTGDHPMTALAISKQVGIISTGNDTAYDMAFKQNVDVSEIKTDAKFQAAVVTGNDLRTLGKDGLEKKLNHFNEIVFARTSPAQKLMIVECCQRLGYVVAVTGDGVNDSPALKRADIGIAMGVTGTDVSKRAADMILLDDDFSSIVLGVEEGRLIFDNLKKSIAYTLTSNTPEMVPFLLHAVLGIPLPLHVLLIIAINVGTDLLPAISLAYEKSEADIMCRAPRKVSEHLVTSQLIFMTYFQIGVMQFCAGIHAYFVVFAYYGFLPFSLLHVKEDWYAPGINDFKDSFGQEWDYESRIFLTKKAQTAYFFAIIVAQVADLLICKTRRVSIFHNLCSNFVMIVAILSELLLGCLLIYSQICNTFFGTVPLEIIFLTPGLYYFILIIFIDEMRKFFIRKYPDGWLEKHTYF